MLETDLEDVRLSSPLFAYLQDHRVYFVLYNVPQKNAQAFPSERVAVQIQDRD